MAGTAVAVCYDFFIGAVTNIIAAAVLHGKAPSLLDDLDKDKPKDPKDEEDGAGIQNWKIRNYPGPQEALNWWETAIRNTNGEQSKAEKERRNKGNQSSESPLKKPNKEMIRCMLANGPDTTIVESAKNGHIDVVKTCLEKGIDINTKDDYGYTSLSYAALKGHAEVVDLLIEYGADINARNHWGGTALVQAVFFGHVDIAKNLIDNGANMNVTIKGDSLVIYAAKNGYDDLVDYLINNSANHRSTKSRNSTDKTQSRFKKWRSKLRNGDVRN